MNCEGSLLRSHKVDLISLVGSWVWITLGHGGGFEWEAAAIEGEHSTSVHAGAHSSASLLRSDFGVTRSHTEASVDSPVRSSSWGSNVDEIVISSTDTIVDWLLPRAV